MKSETNKSDNNQSVSPSNAPVSAAMSDLNNNINNPPKWLTSALSVPRDEGTVDIAGCDIHYFRWGDPSKPGIIMLHGFLAHARCFAFIAPYLAADYHVVAMDLAGMGDSGWREDYTEELRIEELVGVCEHLKLFDHSHKPTIVAHSFGGRIATATMYAHAERFAGLVICDLMIIRPSILLANTDKFGPPGKRDSNRANRVYPDYDTAKQRFVLSPPQAVEEPVLFDFMAFHSLREVEGGWQWKFDPRVFKLPKEQDGSASTPTASEFEQSKLARSKIEHTWAKVGESVAKAPGRKAIIYGKRSSLFTEDSVAYMTELTDQLGTPAIPMIDIPNARHHLMLDQPIAFVTALKTVLALWD